MPRVAAVTLALLLPGFGGVADAQSLPPPAEPLALVNAALVDVRTGRVTPNATIVLRDGRIVSAGTDGAPAGVRRVDLRGRHVLPGLLDAHVHIASIQAARRALESGVTTVRSGGVSNYADVGLRELVRKGLLAGPDVLASGYHVRPQLAEEAFLSDPDLADLMRDGVTAPDAIRRVVRTNLARGADVIKIVATERAGTPDTDPRKQVYLEAQLRAAVEEAATRSAAVLAHAHGDEGAMAAVRAGVRSIEHGTYLSEATLQAMKARGTFFVPTYTTVIDVAQPGGDYDHPALQIRGQHMLPRLRETIVRAHALGVPIVAGSDTAYGPNSLTRIPHEIANLVEIGLPPLLAIRSATTVAADLFGLAGRVGAIEPGFEADLIVVDKDPLADVRTLQDVLMVISNGRIALDRLQLAGPPTPSSP
jgi:imidazolonepropionase-like amidohydrolase